MLVIYLLRTGLHMLVINLLQTGLLTKARHTGYCTTQTIPQPPYTIAVVDKASLTAQFYRHDNERPILSRLQSVVIYQISDMLTMTVSHRISRHCRSGCTCCGVDRRHVGSPWFPLHARLKIILLIYCFHQSPQSLSCAFLPLCKQVFLLRVMPLPLES